MIIRQIPLTDVLTTNAYFYGDEASGHGFLIDPAAEADALLQLIADNHWTIEKILLTHGHFDHIGAVQKLHEKLGIPYYIEKNGKELLQNPTLNLSAFFGGDSVLKEAEFLQEGDVLRLNGRTEGGLKVLHTPGHTPDSVVYYDAKNAVAFVGDTIFKGSVGATHFPLGDDKQLQKSIKNKILTLPPETILYSGHSEPTTVAAEQSNPFID